MSLSAAASPPAGIGSATIVNHCPEPVYYHVSGFKNGRGWDTETKVIPAEGFTMPYDTMVSIKLFHKLTQLEASISQLEFNLDLAAGRIWYDISNVDAFRAGAPPFMEGGMHLSTHGEKQGNCMPVHCEKGERICKDAYNLWNDDKTFVCPQATNLHLVLCPDGQDSSPSAAVAPRQGPQEVRAPRRSRSDTAKLVEVRDIGEDEKLPGKPAAATMTGLTRQNASSSKGRVATFPVLGLIAGVAYYYFIIIIQ